MTVRSASYKSGIGLSPQGIAVGINNLLGVWNPLSLVSASLVTSDDRVGFGITRFSMTFQSGGLANYQADVVTYDGTAGTTFDAQVSAFAQSSTNLFPRYFWDLTSRQDRDLRRAVLIISEVVTASPTDGSYAVGDQGILNRQAHIVEADANIAAGASGLVSLYSPGGRTTQVTGTNRGPAALSTGDRAYAIVDPISQSLYVYPTCC